MANNKKYLIGKRVGKLTVISWNGRCSSGCNWLCKCDCGNETIVEASALSTENTKSCGCGMMGREGIPASILKQKDVIKIRKLWAAELVYRGKIGSSSITMQALSENFGVSLSTISRLLKNKTWRSLPDVQHYMKEFRKKREPLVDKNHREVHLLKKDL